METIKVVVSKNTFSTSGVSARVTLYSVTILDSQYTFESLRKAKKFAASFTKPCFGEVVVWIGQPGGMRA